MESTGTPTRFPSDFSDTSPSPLLVCSGFFSCRLRTLLRGQGQRLGGPGLAGRHALSDAGLGIAQASCGRVLARMPDGSLYLEQTYFPFVDPAGPRTIAEAMPESMWTAIASPAGPLAGGDDGLRCLAEGARRLRRKTDRAIIGLIGGNLLEAGQFFYRTDNFFMLLGGEPPEARDCLDRLVEVHLANLERFLGAWESTSK